jgi:myo-inositol 2-dehydrogenase / D-chiro-inositol 1-dehydrogenase
MNKNRILKIGLIGCGRIAQAVHLRILNRLPNAKIIALAEPDRQRRREAVRVVPWAVAFSDYAELLEIPEVEATVICLPNHLHASAAVAALEKRKHIYLEKPLATDLYHARRVLDAWEDSGRTAMVGFNYRFQKLYQSTKRHIQTGGVGELVGVNTVFSTAGKNLPSWKLSRNNGGGVLLDLASHHIDLIHFLLEQDVAEVFARIQSKVSDGDNAILELRLTNGLLVQSFFSFRTVEEDRFELYGTKGKVTADRYLAHHIEIVHPGRSMARVKKLAHCMRSFMDTPYLLTRWPNYSDPSFYSALRYFVDSVLVKRSAKPDLLDGYRSLAVIEAAEESARTGRAVSPSDWLGKGNYQRSTSGPEEQISPETEA